jgi:hypothetical protein
VTGRLAMGDERKKARKLAIMAYNEVLSQNLHRGNNKTRK